MSEWHWGCKKLVALAFQALVISALVLWLGISCTFVHMAGVVKGGTLATCCFYRALICCDSQMNLRHFLFNTAVSQLSGQECEWECNSKSAIHVRARIYAVQVCVSKFKEITVKGNNTA